MANKSEGLEISYGLDTRPFLITTNVSHVDDDQFEFLITTNVSHVDDDQFEFQPVMYGRRDNGHTP